MSFLKWTTFYVALVVGVYTGAKHLLTSINGISQVHIAVLDGGSGGTTG
jgi:hypothetical protein